LRALLPALMDGDEVLDFGKFFSIARRADNTH
jgi:hypothetical protein